MADDFILQVKQIAQYPAATSVNEALGDVLLLQQGGVGGPYASLNPLTLFQTALLHGGTINFSPDGVSGIYFNGARFTYGAGMFDFSEPLVAPSISAEVITMAGSTLATELYVADLFDNLTNNVVLSFNDRVGHIQLTTDDVRRAGAVPNVNPSFFGTVTAPTPWDYSSATEQVATTAFVQCAIQSQVQRGCIVGSINGRGGNVVLNTDDITIGATTPGPDNGNYARANTPPSGDTSTRIATTMFVDDALQGMEEQVLKNADMIAEILDQQYAPLASPQFTGIPTAPTAPPGTTTGQLATTAYVQAAVTASTTGVSSFNTRTGAVTLTLADVTGAGGAPLASPAFTGNPTAPTQTAGNSSTRLATTAFVGAAIAAVAAGVTSWNTRTGAVVLTAADVTGVGGALLASPALSGTPTAPTAPPATNNTQIATTAYVTTAIAALPAPVSSFNGRTGAVTFQASDISAVGGALLASPNFTGTPTAPTPVAGTSNTTLATTAFVANAVAASTAGVSSYAGRTGVVVPIASDITTAGGALLAGPTFTGVPSAPTAAVGTNSGQLATTAFVAAAIAANPGGVTSFNSRTGAITLLGSDISAAGGALLGSPAFTGTPSAPTAAPATNTTQIATTAFVTAALAAGGGVTSFNGRAGVVTLSQADLLGVSGGSLYSINTAPPTGALATNNQALWWDSTGGNLYVNYNNQWVIANQPQPIPPVAANICLEVNLSATQTGLATGWNTAKFNNVVTDTQGGYNTSNGIYTPKVAGVYLVSVNLVVPIGAVTSIGVAVYKNGTLAGSDSMATQQAPQSAATFGLTATAQIFCNGTTDTISGWGYLGTSGGQFAASNATAGLSQMIVTPLQSGPQGVAGPAGAAGGLVYLSQQANSSAGGGLVFPLPAGYNRYVLYFDNFVAVSASSALIQVSEDGGTTWKNAQNYQYTGTSAANPSSASGGVGGASAAVGIPVTWGYDLSTTINGAGGSGHVEIGNPNKGPVFMRFDSALYNSTAAYSLQGQGNWYGDYAAINAIKIFCNNSVSSNSPVNFTGRAALYGLVN